MHHTVFISIQLKSTASSDESQKSKFQGFSCHKRIGGGDGCGQFNNQRNKSTEMLTDWFHLNKCILYNYSFFLYKNSKLQYRSNKNPISNKLAL